MNEKLQLFSKRRGCRCSKVESSWNCSLGELITSSLFNLLAFLGSDSLVSQSDHVAQGFPLHLGQVAGQLAVPGRVRTLKRSHLVKRI